MTSEQQQQKVESTGYVRLIERSINEGTFRQLLSSDPDAALKDIGLWVNDPDERALMAERLTESIKSPQPAGEEVACTACLVIVGVAIGTNLSEHELADREIYRREIRARVARVIDGQFED
ncbi:hypothetical protein [Streptomyces roseoverticillatus]|uniref:Uncharacterized protein n=1 Tax=Streptomyces roseoverticillatus TaxID=66429 RepID=A0ABV3IX61_9ACTN